MKIPQLEWFIIYHQFYTFSPFSFSPSPVPFPLLFVPSFCNSFSAYETLVFPLFLVENGLQINRWKSVCKLMEKLCKSMNIILDYYLMHLLPLFWSRTILVFDLDADLDSDSVLESFLLVLFINKTFQLHFSDNKVNYLQIDRQLHFSTSSDSKTKCQLGKTFGKTNTDFSPPISLSLSPSPSLSQQCLTWFFTMAMFL